MGAGEAAGRTNPEEAAEKEPGRQGHRQGAVSGKVRGTTWWQLLPSGTELRAYVPPRPAPCYLEEGSWACRSRGEQGHPDPRCRPGAPWAPAGSEAESAGVTNRVGLGWGAGREAPGTAGVQGAKVLGNLGDRRLLLASVFQKSASLGSLTVVSDGGKFQDRGPKSGEGERAGHQRPQQRGRQGRGQAHRPTGLKCEGHADAGLPAPQIQQGQGAPRAGAVPSCAATAPYLETRI